MKTLAGKVALVTGGSRGIGRAITLALAEDGADIAINYATSEQAAEAACQACRENGVRAYKYKANVANDEENHAMIDQVQRDLGTVQILVNNAGITRDRSFAKMTYELWHEVLQVNLTAPAMVTHACLPGMIESGWGRVVFIASIVGQMGNFGQSNYAAAKGGVMSLAKTLAREVARKGVTVNVVAPGYIATDMVAAVPEKVLEQVRAMTPVGRLGEPDEVASAVRYLVSPAASYVTGEVLNVNGGMYM